MQTRGPEFKPQEPEGVGGGDKEKARLVACVCTLSPGEAETGGSLRNIDQPA